MLPVPVSLLVVVDVSRIALGHLFVHLGNQRFYELVLFLLSLAAATTSRRLTAATAAAGRFRFAAFLRLLFLGSLGFLVDSVSEFSPQLALLLVQSVGVLDLVEQHLKGFGELLLVGKADHHLPDRALVPQCFADAVSTFAVTCAPGFDASVVGLEARLAGGITSLALLGFFGLDFRGAYVHAVRAGLAAFPAVPALLLSFASFASFSFDGLGESCSLEGADLLELAKALLLGTNALSVATLATFFTLFLDLLRMGLFHKIDVVPGLDLKSHRVGKFLKLFGFAFIFVTVTVTVAFTFAFTFTFTFVEQALLANTFVAVMTAGLLGFFGSFSSFFVGFLGGLLGFLGSLRTLPVATVGLLCGLLPRDTPDGSLLFATAFALAPARSWKELPANNSVAAANCSHPHAHLAAHRVEQDFACATPTRVPEREDTVLEGHPAALLLHLLAGGQRVAAEATADNPTFGPS